MVIPKKVLGVSLVVIVLAAGAYYLVVEKGVFKADSAGGTGGAASSGTPAGGNAAGQQTTEAAPLPVTVVPARRGDLVMTLKSPGEAYTEKKIAVKSEVSGDVKNLYAVESGHVKENDVLVEIDDQQYRLNLEKIEAMRIRYLSELLLEKQFATEQKATDPVVLEKYRKAQTAYEQSLSGFQAGKVSAMDLESSRRSYETALIETGLKKDEIMATTKGLTSYEIDAKISRLTLEKTRIKAPFAGIVTDIKISPREHIDAGREICTLVDISRIKVKAKVLESEVGKMKVGREVDLRFSAYPGKVFKGTVTAVSPLVSAEDKTCAVHIAVPNPAEELKPGMHAEVEIAAEIHKGKLLVPQEAILTRSGRKLVFVVEGDLAKWRYVQIGVENEKFAEILEGVQDGEPVIVEGHFTLAHDAKVSMKK